MPTRTRFHQPVFGHWQSTEHWESLPVGSAPPISNLQYRLPSWLDTPIQHESSCPKQSSWLRIVTTRIPHWQPQTSSNQLLMLLLLFRFRFRFRPRCFLLVAAIPHHRHCPRRKMMLLICHKGLSCEEWNFWKKLCCSLMLACLARSTPASVRLERSEGGGGRRRRRRRSDNQLSW